MKKNLLTLVFLGSVALLGCNEPQSFSSQPPAREIQERPKTPEEILGIKEPNTIAASVEAWAKSNELGDYFKQSRENLAKIHAQLLEDYKVRKESNLEPTGFTREMLGKYNEAYEADASLVKFMVECYSRKEVRPLPQSISRRFSTAIEDRGEMRRIIKEAPTAISQLRSDFDSIKSELANMGSFSWSQEKELNEWKRIQQQISNISSRTGKDYNQATVLLADLEKVSSSDMQEQSYDLRDQAERLKVDLSSFSNKVIQQLEIVNGQILLTGFSDNCKAVIEGINAVPSALGKKRKRMSEIKEVTSKLTSSRSRGYSDLDSLDQQAAALKARSQTESLGEIELGNRIQKLARNYQNIFGSTAILRLKKELPVESARAQIDTYLSNFKRSISASPDINLSSVFTNLESKAYQLSDQMEEEKLLKRMDETLNAVKRLAQSGR